MIRRLIIAALLIITTMIVPLTVHAQTATVTGHVIFPSGGAATAARVCFTLQNYKPNIPRISATGIVVQQTNWCVIPAADGSYSTSIVRNDLLSPIGTFWRMDFLWNSQQQSSASWRIDHSPFNLDTETPLSQAVIAGPNQTITECKSFQQVSAATTWTFTHGENDLGVFVWTTDLSGNLIFPDHVNTNDPNTAVITWFTATSGRALACHGGSISIATNQPNAIVSNPVGTQTMLNTQSFIVNAPTTLNNLVSATSSATNPASTGLLRLASGDTINWRNSANTGDLSLQILGSQGGNWPPDTLFYRGRNDGNAVIEADAFASNDGPSNIPVSGFLRMGSTRTLVWRNNANSADVALARAGASDSLTWPFAINAGTNFNAGINGSFNTGNANPALTGTVKLASSDTINWRNNANGADVALSKNASDQLMFNGVVVGDVSLFRATWGGVAFGMATTGSIATFSPDKAITVTTIGYSSPAGQALGAGCATQPTIRVSDGTTIGAQLTLTNGAASGALGGLSLNYPAGSTLLRIEIAFAAAGCGTAWGNVNLWAQYRMQ